jgi:hypothetical protein
VTSLAVGGEVVELGELPAMPRVAQASTSSRPSSAMASHDRHRQRGGMHQELHQPSGRCAAKRQRRQAESLNCGKLADESATAQRTQSHPLHVEVASDLTLPTRRDLDF